MVEMLADPFLIVGIPIWFVLFGIVRCNTRGSAYVFFGISAMFTLISMVYLTSYRWAITLVLLVSVILLFGLGRQSAKEFKNIVFFEKGTKLGYLIQGLSLISLGITLTFLIDYKNIMILLKRETVELIIIVVTIGALYISFYSNLFYEILSPIFSRKFYENEGKIKDFVVVIKSRNYYGYQKKEYLVMFENDNTYYSVGKKQFLKYANHKDVVYNYTCRMSFVKRKVIVGNIVKLNETTLNTVNTEPEKTFVISKTNVIIYIIMAIPIALVCVALMLWSLFYGINLIDIYSNQYGGYNTGVQVYQWFIFGFTFIASIAVVVCGSVWVRKKKRIRERDEENKSIQITRIEANKLGERQKIFENMN